jgi:aminopeptidase Y
MARILSILALSVVTGASIIQHPLQENSGQAAINNKPLVGSEALESHITSENLLKRAKQLYKIAELGAEEYNHPTRVIGSKGRFQSTNAHS